MRLWIALIFLALFNGNCAVWAQAGDELDALHQSISELSPDSEEFDQLAQKIRSVVGSDTLTNPKHVYALARLSVGLQDFESMDRYCKRLLDIEKDAKNIRTYEAHYNLGLTYNMSFDLENSLSHFIKSAEIAEFLKDNYALSRAYTMMSYIGDLLHPDNHEENLRYVNEAISYCLKANDDDELGWAYNNKANIYRSLDIDSAIYFYHKSEQSFRKTGEVFGLINLYYNLATLYSEKEENEPSLKALLSSIRLSEEIGDYSMLSITHAFTANIYGNLNQKDSTLYHIEKAKNYFELSPPEETHEYYLLLALSYKSMEDYEIALNYAEQAFSAQDSLFMARLSQELGDMRVKYETAKKERKLAEKESALAASKLAKSKEKSQRIEAENDRKILIRVLISVLVISCFIVLWLRQKRVADKAKKELLANQLEQKNLQAERLKEELRFKNQSLTSYSILVAQKNEILQELNEWIAKNGDKVESASDMTSLIRSSRSFDNEWDEFRVLFDEVHQGYIDRITKNYPELSPNEIRLCALLKLNLSSKQMASILNIAPRSVDVSRSRLRKKLNIGTNENLSEYISKL